MDRLQFERLAMTLSAIEHKYDEAMEDSTSSDWLKFYCPQDSANNCAVERSVELTLEHSRGSKTLSLNDALELHNTLEFEEHGIFPCYLGQHERENLASAARQARGRVASFLSGLDPWKWMIFLEASSTCKRRT